MILRLLHSEYALNIEAGIVVTTTLALSNVQNRKIKLKHALTCCCPFKFNFELEIKCFIKELRN